MAQTVEDRPAESPIECRSRPAWLRADSLMHGIALMLVLAVVQRGIGLFRNVMICRLLAPDQLGTWNLAYNFLLLAAPLVVCGIPGSFKRYLEYYRQRGRLHAFLRQTTIATLALLVFGVSVLLLARRPLAWLVFGNTDASGLLCVCATVLITVIAFNFCVELLTAMRQVRVVSWLQFGNSLLFAVSALLLAAGSWRATGVILGYGIACGMTGLVAAGVIVASLRGHSADPLDNPPFDLWLRLLPFAAWLWFSDLLTNLFAAVDRYMIVHFAQATPADGLSMVGQYHSSRIFGEVLVALSCMVGGVLLSYSSHDWEVGKRAAVRRLLDLSLLSASLALTAAAAITLLLAPWLFQLLFAEKYVSGLAVMPWTLVGCLWFCLLMMANNYLWCCEKAWCVGLAVSLGLVANAALNLWWLPRWGSGRCGCCDGGRQRRRSGAGDGAESTVGDAIPPDNLPGDGFAPDALSRAGDVARDPAAPDGHRDSAWLADRRGRTGPALALVVGPTAWVVDSD